MSQEEKEIKKVKEVKTDVNKGEGAVRRAASSLYSHLTPAQRSKMAGLMLLTFISAIFDVFGLASILPVVKLASDSQQIHKNYYLETVYQSLGFQSDNRFLFFLLMSVFIFFLLKSIFGFIVNLLQTRLSGQIASHITRKQFNKYFNLDFIRFNSVKSSVVIHHIINNPISYMNWVVLPLIMLVSESMIVILIVTGIAIYDIQLFLFIACIVGPTTWGIYALMRNRTSRIGSEMNRILPLALGTLTQTITGYIDIKLADKERYYRDRFMSLQTQYNRLEMSAYLQNLIPLRANELVALSGVILIFVYALFITRNAGSAIVMVSLFAAAAYRLMPSLNRIITSLMYVRKNQTALENLELYSELEHELKDEGPGRPISFKNSIEIKNVSFRFPDKDEWVIKDINLEIKKGEKIGIVGASGSGKTTLMNLILRFYEEQEGYILVDGHPLQRDQTRSWRDTIGYVKQDIFLMDASIRENITFSDDNVDEERLKMAITQASLDELVNSLPDGLNSSVGERGSKLSGGQRQRISIARSLYRNAEILIFDEATSALDSQTEQEVSEAIDRLSEVHKTVFIIAHRITTLRNCDRIYELKDGKIHGIFSYHELIEKVI
jgi:ABC-type multidrug transport system fused ATPase/permease subunit